MEAFAEHVQEAAGLRDQIQALQEEAAALQAERERMRAELQEAAAARKTAEAAVRDSGVALKQKDVELSLLKATHNKDMQWQQESIRKLQVWAYARVAACTAGSRCSCRQGRRPETLRGRPTPDDIRVMILHPRWHA